MTDESMPDRTTNPDDPASNVQSETESPDLGDVAQDVGVGPIDGQEAMDDDSEFSHTPISPTR